MMTKIAVQNLKCGGCANTIKRNLDKMEGISDVHVEIESAEVTFNFESDTRIDAVKQSLKTMGYPAMDDENTLSAKAKSYVSCGMGRLMNN
ncbi:MAG: heavy metal-associated domain-containing protein [Allomuricauda sp.]